MAQISAGLELVDAELHREVVDGRTYLVAAPPPASAARASADPVVRLLQSLDEHVVGYQESRDVVDLAGLEAANWLTLGLPPALVIVDGQIAGSLAPDGQGQAGRRRRRGLPAFDDAELEALRVEAVRHAAAWGRGAELTTSTQ